MITSKCKLLVVGEDIGAAAEREVFEETGIKCVFQSVICFRHQHNYRFRCSDFYFICLMRPLTDDITQCQHEISKCKWMDVSFISFTNNSGDKLFQNVTADRITVKSLTFISP